MKINDLFFNSKSSTDVKSLEKIILKLTERNEFLQENLKRQVDKLSTIESRIARIINSPMLKQKTIETKIIKKSFECLLK